MYLYGCTNNEQYLSIFHGTIFRDRYHLEGHLALSNEDRSTFTVAGVCKVCSKAVDFLVDHRFGTKIQEGVRHPNWRERQVCPSCQLNSRQRAAVAFVLDFCGRRSATGVKVYAMEQVTPVYKECNRRLPAGSLVGSEYLGPGTVGGNVVKGIRHEDAENLSFEENEFDLVVSNDVLEHVSDHRRCLEEVFRVLRPGGELFLTTPFSNERARNHRRAELRNGSLTMLEPPQYHGNPLSKEGSLVFVDFGWELLEDLRQAQFDDVTLIIFWSYQYGHLGIPQEFFHARKRT